MSLFRSMSGMVSRGANKLILTLTALFLALMLPVSAMAAGAEANIKLEFSDSDKIYLWISLGFGILAIVVGWMIMQSVLKRDRGTDKMKEVGDAIQAGALAYLKQQFSTMGIFVIILGVLIYFMYQNTFGPMVAGLTAGAMVLGVLASYGAGYIGMYMAVNANSRAAAAALTSYKKSLETAFQAGSVAGLMTVGMGLLGATLIFLLFTQDATKILIGFGFGGSLAALFMRVGGGIFTKAADVGADLVGKVEAGIPEDDPRNPATIADNVGDNVGDCAGMAADVFESYEVTLVAAIVLGAATAAIFPQEIWIKLILFAMMARGVGILASIVGIFMVKGSDDINYDPLKSIGRGFKSSIVIAALATAGLAYFMLGNTVQTNKLITTAHLDRQQTLDIKKIQSRIAKEKNIEADEVTTADITDDADFKALDIDEQEAGFIVPQALTTNVEDLGEEPDMSKYRLTNLAKEGNPLEKMSIVDPSSTNTQSPEFITFKEAIANEPLEVVHIEVSQPAVNQETGEVDPDQPPTVTPAWIGPIQKSFIPFLEKSAKDQGQEITIKVDASIPAKIFVDEDNKIVAGIEQSDVDKLDKALADEFDLSQVFPQLQAFEEDPATVTDFITKSNAGQLEDLKQPTPLTASFAFVEHKSAEWWRFALCVGFGLVMALVFEKLTDYYVGLNKRPVQEIGEVASAGPAPMIISGFAYGAESSVFSVFAIVACLITPILIFPPAEFGGYLLSFFGIALVGLGLLTTTGFILAMDTFGPISDNAQGVFEMSGADEDNKEGARRVQLLDAAGNTTKALTKGFAIATAVVAAVALFHAYVEEGHLGAVGMRLEIPEIFLGLIIGGAAPYLFSAFSIQAVGRAAFELINEVRRQFKNDPGIMKGTSKPDYSRCVAISTKAAQRELLSPGILAIAFPLLVGFGFAIGKPLTNIGGAEYNLVGAQALGGFLAGTILSGQLMAVLLANSGGMWDNSKKLIEDGMHGGKGTEAHKAAVVCDTVGDPFKDTAGPALNPLIKVMNLVALLIVPQVIMPWSTTVQVGVTLGAAALLGIAIYLSKRSSLGQEMQTATSGANASAEASLPETGNTPAPEETFEDKVKDVIEDKPSDKGITGDKE